MLASNIGHTQVTLLRTHLKQWLYRLLGKDPEAVIVTFATGDPGLCRRMAQEIRELVPDRRHFLATEQNWPELRIELQRYRIGLVLVMLPRQPSPLRRPPKAVQHPLRPERTCYPRYGVILNNWSLRTERRSLAYAGYTPFVLCPRGGDCRRPGADFERAADDACRASGDARTG